MLRDNWYQNRAKNDEDERVRIAECAGHIILQDIRSRYYNTSVYEVLNSKSDLFLDIPRTLQALLNVIIKTNKRMKNPTVQMKWDKRVATYAHGLISSARLRSFLSPILLGLSAMMHKKHVSKNLIDFLSYLEFYSSYNEALLFEASIVNDPLNHSISDNCFMQFVFDNADHNTNTLDGRNTFHVMGGIMCVTPLSAVSCKKTIKRLSKIPSENSIKQVGLIRKKTFERGISQGLKNVIILDLNVENAISNEIDITSSDILWFYGKHTNATKTPGWNGFMENYYKSQEFFISKIIPQRFVKAPPSDYDTILTVLIEAATECKKRNQKHCFVTFDQPLYFKAREIVASVDLDKDIHNVTSVIVRLGGFHLLMSFLSSVGFIMNGSGLKEAFSLIYAETSAEKALTGHAFSRAVRGHLLVHLALSKIIFSSLDLFEHEEATLNSLLQRVEENNFHDLIK